MSKRLAKLMRVLSFCLYLLAINIATRLAFAQATEGLSKTSVGRFGWRNTGEVGGNGFFEGLLCFSVTPNSIIKWVGGKKWTLNFYLGKYQPPEALVVKKERVVAMNWVSKQISVDGRYQLIFNVLYPAVLIKSTKERIISLVADTKFSYLALEAAGKPKVLRLSNKEIVYDKISDGALSANWLLLWGDEADPVVPVLLVSQHNPSQVILNNGKVSILYDKAVDFLAIATPFGIKHWQIENIKSYSKGLPEDILSICQLWSRALLAYPIECYEFYEILEPKESPQAWAKITNKYNYIEVSDDWQTKPIRLAPIPPSLSFMKAKGYPVKIYKKLINLNCPTYYGELEAVWGSSEVSYLLPVPPIDNAVLLNVPEEQKLIREVNLQVKDSLIRTLEERLKNPERLDLGGFLWRMPLLKLLLDEENKNLVDKFWKYVFEAHLENPKVWTKKTEPFSKKQFVHWKFLPDGDHDAAAGISLSELYNYFLWSEDLGFIKANWRWIKQIYHYFEVVNDWAWMGSSCRDWGGGGVGIDMAWDAWAGLDSMQVMAEAIGDEATYQHVCYLRSKQAIPTLMRFCGFRDYLISYDAFQFEEGQTTSLVGEPDADGKLIIPKFYNTKYLGGREVSYELGFPSGDGLVNACDWRPGGFIFLSDIIPEATREYLRWIDKYCPQWYERPPGIGLERMWWEKLAVIIRMLSPIVLLRGLANGEPKEQLKYYLDRMFSIPAEAPPEHTHPLLGGAPYLYSVVATWDCPIWLAYWQPAKLLWGYYKKTERIATLGLQPLKDKTIVIKLRYKEPPIGVCVNNNWVGRRLSFKELKDNLQGFYIDQNYIYINLQKGEAAVTVEVYFDRVNWLSNPSFEQNIIYYSPCWMLGGEATISEELAHSGNRSAKLYGAANAGLYQDLNLPPGIPYEVTFWYNIPKDLAPDYEIHLRVQDANKVYFKSFKAATDGWQKCIIQVPERPVSIKSRARIEAIMVGKNELDKSRFVYIDDVNLKFLK